MAKIKLLPPVIILTGILAACNMSQPSSGDTPQKISSPPAAAAEDPHKMGNRPILSAGHGKELGDFKSGIYTMTSAGLDRKYTIDIPANYDKNTPYRLIFCMHYLGGHMATMVSEKFYGLKPLADRDKVPVIFVAPEGYTDGSPWRGRDDKDHVFFDDMLTLCKNKMSIDTTRVFCVGFSFGAMVTYSLSLDHQKDLRAVACYAPANWNIFLPTDKHEPIPFYSTTGTNDGTCKWINSDPRQQGGKYCVLGHLTDNGVAHLPEIPLATTAKHITTEFQGTKDNYPVIFGSFVGPHTDSARDPGSNANWIPKETWDFFMRF
jgi:poly(3-hydroxybutyrate) depolymerase